MDSIYNQKEELINNIQEYFNNCQRINEASLQKRCENDLELRSMQNTIRKQEETYNKQKKEVSYK